MSEDEDFSLEQQGIYFSSILDTVKEDNACSPDILSMTLRGSQLVFITGNMKASVDKYLNQFYLEQAVFVGTGMTVHSNFSIWRYNKDYPIVLNEPAVGTPNKARIYGEVYLVSPTMLANLDTYEERGIHSTRGKQQILINKPFGIRDHAIEVFVHMYYNKFDAWRNAIREGELEPCSLYFDKRNPQDKYYIWNKRNSHKYDNKRFAA